jgi:uncharacterized membrane protein (DUF485 family)
MIMTSMSWSTKFQKTAVTRWLNNIHSHILYYFRTYRNSLLIFKIWASVEHHLSIICRLCWFLGQIIVRISWWMTCIYLFSSNFTFDNLRLAYDKSYPIPFTQSICLSVSYPTCIQSLWFGLMRMCNAIYSFRQNKTRRKLAQLKRVI